MAIGHSHDSHSHNRVGEGTLHHLEKFQGRTPEELYPVLNQALWPEVWGTIVSSVVHKRHCAARKEGCPDR